MNVYFYQEMVKHYQSLQVVRLDPANTQSYSKENDGIDKLWCDSSLVVFFGDSRIAYWKSFPDLENGRIVNRGVPGETTAQAVLRLQLDVLDLKPDIVVIQTGINDLKNIGIFPERKDEIIKSCWENLNTMVGQIIERDIQLVILTVFQPGPMGLLRRSIWSNDIYEGIDWINDKIKTLRDRGVTVLDCDIILSHGGRMKPQYADDTFHLNNEGYQTLNRSLCPVLQEQIDNRL